MVWEREAAVWSRWALLNSAGKREESGERVPRHQEGSRFRRRRKTKVASLRRRKERKERPAHVASDVGGKRVTPTPLCFCVCFYLVPFSWATLDVFAFLLDPHSSEYRFFACVA